MYEEDNLSQQWGAWGGDRKLSPRFRTLMSERSRLERASNRRLVVAAIAALVCILAVFWGL